MAEFECLETVEGSNQNHDLVLYALSTCGWCKKARQFLEENSIRYQYVYVDLLGDNVEKDAVLEECFSRNPNRTFPTLVIDDKDVIIGFSDATYKEKLL